MASTSDSVNILIGGDVCPVNRYQDLFLGGSQEQILGPFAAQARQADLFIANLECPLIHGPSPILKTGPVLGVDAACARGLKTMGLHAVGVANNHIMDHGAPGLDTTLEACAANGIATFGAGAGLADASRIRVTEVKGLRVGLMALAEREWSIATPAAPGANPLDPIAFVRQMKESRARMDVLVVLVHAGCEGYQLPSPELRKICQFLVEEGANVVACQHSHCVGCYETYRDQLIVYGQGNFVFDYGFHGYQEQGMFISLQVDAHGLVSFEMLPFIQGGSSVGLAAMEPEAEARFRAELESRSSALGQEGFVETSWEAYCQSRKLSLLDEVLDHGWLLQRVNRNGALLNLRGRRYYKNLLSIVQNRSMVETLDTLLRGLLE